VLAVSYLTCALLLMVVVEIVHRRIVKPVVDQFDRALSAASRAARALVAALTAKRPAAAYVWRAEPEIVQVRSHDAIPIRLDNRRAQVLGWDEGHQLIYGRNTSRLLTPPDRP
jgi:hypothetical protein